MKRLNAFPLAKAAVAFRLHFRYFSAGGFIDNLTVLLAFIENINESSRSYAEISPSECRGPERLKRVRFSIRRNSSDASN